MHALSAATLLQIWERGQGRSPTERALDLLAAACPDEHPAAIAALSLGARDARLMRLRGGIFGTAVVATAACPQCADRVELRFDLADVQVAATGEPPPELDLDLEGYRLRFRLPNSYDLAAAGGAPDPAAARQLILARCLLAASGEAGPVAADDLPAPVLRGLLAQAAAADPLADVQLDLTCPACGQAWRAAFDILSYLWSEIDTWAARTLHEVHRLASAYGWPERDILSLSAWRRRYYLDLVGGR